MLAMNWWLLILPVTGALLGWCFVYCWLLLVFHPTHEKKIAGLPIQGMLPKNKIKISEKIAALAASFLPAQEIAEKITHPDNVKKIMPQAEEQIDHFLRVKLVKSMPVVGMFVGDKTINNLKSLFIAELEELFPVIMKNYIDRLEEDIDIEKIVASRLLIRAPELIEKAFVASRRERQKVARIGALLGFAIGLIQLLIVHFLIR
jgi:uncharacterized membrane protein YheB (UPF0754 family)